MAKAEGSSLGQSSIEVSYDLYIRRRRNLRRETVILGPKTGKEVLKFET